MSSTLYLDKRGLALSLQSRALILHQDGSYLRSIPLSMIDRIVCRASVELKSSVLANLAEENIGVSLFGGRRGARQVHLAVNGTRDVSRRIAQYRVFSDVAERLRWSKRLVSFKLARQERLLRRALKQRPDCRRVLVGAVESIRKSRASLVLGVGGSMDALRGLEGAAAREYFKAYAALMPDSIGFTGRNRRPPRDPANAVLSLGYTLLHGQMVQAIESTGLDAALGVFHEPAFGRDSLAADLTELYRCHVDQLAWDLFRKRELTDSDFSFDGDACLLSKQGRAVFYPASEQALEGVSARARRLSLRVVREWQQ